MRIELEVPVRTRNESNVRKHWRGRYGRSKAARTKVSTLFPKWKVEPCVRVTLTRVSAGELDTDGLQAALKAVRDEVARCMAVDDRTRLVEWIYRQERGDRGKPSVRILVEAVNTDAEALKRQVAAAIDAATKGAA